MPFFVTNFKHWHHLSEEASLTVYSQNLPFEQAESKTAGVVFDAVLSNLWKHHATESFPGTEDDAVLHMSSKLHHSRYADSFANNRTEQSVAHHDAKLRCRNSRFWVTKIGPPYEASLLGHTPETFLKGFSWSAPRLNPRKTLFRECIVSPFRSA